MKTQASDSVAALEAVAQQFNHWRSSREKPTRPIPEDLWDSAVGLCEKLTVSRVARALGLSHARLKKRVQDDTPGLRFMEMDFSGFAGGWEVECRRRDGVRLRISGNGPVPIEQMLQGFLA
jgi:hypothetical protein